MQERSDPMTGNFVLFLVLSLAILIGHQLIMARLNPPPEQPDQQAEAAEQPDGQEPNGQEPKDPAEIGPDDQPEPEEEPETVPAEEPADVAQPEVAQQWLTLGSTAEDSPYRMMVTLTNQGASVASIELNNPRYGDLNRAGYLGLLDESLVDEAIGGKGCLIQVVGPGTPAAAAGLQPGDVLLEIGEKPVDTAEQLRKILDGTKPGPIPLVIRREGKDRTLQATLARRPLPVVRPEKDDPLSFRLTLQHVEGQEIGAVTLESPEALVDVGTELKGLDLWTSNWEVVSADRVHAKFAKVLPELGLRVVKTYRLAEVPKESQDDANFRAYHLLFDVEIENLSGESRKVAYQLDGPTGLPAEGAWHSHKQGLRDVIVCLSDTDTPDLVNCPEIADAEVDESWKKPIKYIGIDAQYFACVLAPQKRAAEDIWLAKSLPLRVGEVDEKHKELTNTSCRLVSEVFDLAPRGKPGDAMTHQYEVFAGPKKPAVLTQYGLDAAVDYGWFDWISRPMGSVLHVFAKLGNYGVAILLLTVLVRGCMFPLSRKQALGAQKMQELQPEMKRIQEKYKKDMEARTKAQQDLFRKHNYNPLSGCLVLFFQLPIFIALYRLLSVDIELRQAPLIHESVRWCSNLAAPDMLLNWTPFVPAFVSNWSPYFNILPIFTIVLFIMQQKMFMPPPTDDQQAMQQKIMKYMMIFFGFLFFKVASGLCVYFIASSLWGLAERKLLPKNTPPAAPAAARSRADVKAEAKAKSKPTASGNNGGPPSKKKGKKR